ncbi:hypothetical protein F5884DRAFT_827612 [Xylogone sp. PMI_703]|nr:hypothetical protein F5884DRAFT_827612 [Xylogone sp. PMI_703]
MITLNSLDCQCNTLSKILPDAVFSGTAARFDLWSNFQAEVVPQCRVEPQNASDVAKILAVAKVHWCHFAVLAGGTSPFRYASNADGGITIDMRRMKSVQIVDDQLLHVKVGAGAIWADVYRELDPRNMSATGTRNSLTGVTGSILGGGISFFSQRFGWSCDTVVAFEAVLANGTVVNATQSSHPDLFFALRGGGNNFAIVTSVIIEAFRDPPSWYTFQLWDLGILGVVFRRLQEYTAEMPIEVWQLATTLGWHVPTQQFVISERIVASELPNLPGSLHYPGGELGGRISMPRETYLYQRSTLHMSQKMDYMNLPGFYNYFGSVTVKSDARVHLALADIFCEEVFSIQKAAGLQVYVVYNPLTVKTLQKMQTRGGNSLGIKAADGPLTIVNINLHWSSTSDTALMTNFIRRLTTRFRQRAQELGMHHPYLFQNHAFEEQDVFTGYGNVSLAKLKRIRRQVDPEGIFQTLQPGFFKLGDHIDTEPQV